MNLDGLTKKKNIIIHRSGSYVANLVKMKNADAAMVWEAVAILRADDVDSIPIARHLPVPWVDTVTSATGKAYKLTPVRVTICDLKCSDQRKQARAFMAFVVSERVRDILAEHGFAVPEGLRRQEYRSGIPTPGSKPLPTQSS
jgi:ABC-type molybdate transport system substrate-binding protein